MYANGRFLRIRLNQLTLNDHFLNNVTLAQFREVFKDSPQIGIGDDFCVIDMRFQSKGRVLNYPFRFDGILLVWCLEGQLKVSINLNEYELKDNSLFVFVPGNIFKINEIVAQQMVLISKIL